MKKELTTAESTLSTMATVVLVLGIIASIFVFFSSCIIWDISYDSEIEGIDGINWLGFSNLIYCIMATLVSWSLLSVIVEISVNIRGKENDMDLYDWENKFIKLCFVGDEVNAKKLLLNAILNSSELKGVLSGGKEDFHEEQIKKFYNAFGDKLKKVGISDLDFNLMKEISAPLPTPTFNAENGIL